MNKNTIVYCLTRVVIGRHFRFWLFFFRAGVGSLVASVPDLCILVTFSLFLVFISRI